MESIFSSFASQVIDLVQTQMSNVSDTIEE